MIKYPSLGQRAIHDLILFLGYGDYYPETDGGKVFFIFYALFTISLVLVVLAKCGDILTSINAITCNLILKGCPPMKRYITSEALNIYLMLLMNIIWFHIGVGIVMENTDPKWSYIDSIYFWVVTFTTVGFGDKLLSYESQNAALPYRLVGLSLIAAIIDAISKWVSARKERLQSLVANKAHQIGGTIKKNNSVDDGITNEKVEMH